MEVERKVVMEEEEEELETSEMDKTLSNGDGEMDGEVVEEHRRIFFDANKGLWKCRNCDWTYWCNTPRRDDDVINHQVHCQSARDLEEGTVTTVNPRSNEKEKWGILKAIVYGGLLESITSLSVVSAAGASGAKTSNIFVMGMSNLIGGLSVLYHDLMDMHYFGNKYEHTEGVDHYLEHLGKRSLFQLHFAVAMLSYILFGMLPPVIYGCSFRESDNREYKMLAVAGVSLVCISALAIGKAHVRTPRTYMKTLMYYLTTGVSASGLSYVVGVLATRLLVYLGLFDHGAPAPAPAPPSLFPDLMISGTDA